MKNKTGKKTQYFRYMLALILVQQSPAVTAAIEDGFAIQLGGFSVYDFESTVRINSSSGGLGTLIDLEDDLKVDRQLDVFRLDGYYRFSNKHRMDFSYFNYERNGFVAIDQEITFRDTTYAVDTQISSRNETQVIKLSYAYSFINDAVNEVSIGAGLHTFTTDIKLSTPGAAIEEQVDGTVPLPVFGFSGRHRFSSKLSMKAKIEKFVISQDQYSGSFDDFLIAVDYQLISSLGLGIGWNRISYDFKAKDDELDGELESLYSGALIYANFIL